MSEFDLNAHNINRAARMKLQDIAGWEDRDRVSFINGVGDVEFLTIPKGLSLADKLRVIDVYEYAHSVGTEHGRYTLAGELRSLLKAAKDD